MIPRRAISAFATTVVALALLLSFKTPEGPALAGSLSSATAIVGQRTPASAGPVIATASLSDTTAGSTATVGPATTAPTGPSATPTDAAPKTAAFVDGTVSGPVVSTRFGDVQVQVTITAGVVDEVAALQLPSGDGHSRQISKAAEPILREEALTAQSASIDLLSGATYTSRAYVKSLQAALDQARA